MSALHKNLKHTMSKSQIKKHFGTFVMKTTRYVILFFNILLLLFLSACSEPVEQKETIRPVRYQQIVRVTSEKQRTFSGVSESRTEVQLSFRVAGVIKSINVVVGQRIKKGGLIASIDNSDATLDYEKAVDAQKNTKVQVGSALSNFNRVKDLYENDNVSLSEYEAARNKLSLTKSDYSASKKNSTLKKRALEYCNLYSPMDGVVVSEDANENENVTAGQSIIKINSEDDIQVVVGIPEKYIAIIRDGDKAVVVFSSFLTRKFQGVVTEISYTTSSSSTYPVKINLLENDASIRPGMPATVAFTIPGDKESSFFLVPANSVGEDDSGNFIFTVVPEEKGYGIVSKKNIKVGKLTDKGFQVLSGVEEDDLIITAGINKMTHGKKVKFLKDK